MKVNKSLLLLSTIDAFGLDSKEASNFLQRQRRANSNKYFGYEEVVEGNMKSECYDEDCSQSEALEAIENIKLTTLFWQYRANPCKKFDMCDGEGTESCLDAKNTDELINEDFRCVCKTGYSGDLCNINCNDSTGQKPLTALSPSNAFSASSIFNEQFGAHKAQFSKDINYATDGGAFDVAAGGFPYVWMSQTEPNQEWLQIDLGERRTLFKFGFRGGFYKGKSCLPETLRLEVRKYSPYEELASDDIIELTLNKDEIKPQFIVLDDMIFGQYIRFVAAEATETPVCLAVEVFGKGGRLEKMYKNNC